MGNTDYLFIDESGDSGDGRGDSSDYYAELVLHLSRTSYYDFIKHITNWRYVKSLSKEMKKLPKGPDMERFVRPISVLQDDGLLSCSWVYLTKAKFTGPYLRADSPKGIDSIKFRNFVHRQLLEFHFSQYSAMTPNIELVFDRFEMSSHAIKNLEDYLKGNYNLPTFRHITHADSTYTEALQVASQLVNLTCS